MAAIAHKDLDACHLVGPEAHEGDRLPYAVRVRIDGEKAHTRVPDVEAGNTKSAAASERETPEPSFAGIGVDALLIHPETGAEETALIE
jgi:hypothetical protein